VIRYAGVYSGPSYGTADPRDGFEGFKGIEEAVACFRQRQGTSGAYRLNVRNLTVDADWKITGQSADRTCWPATTPQDTLELYRVYEHGDGYAVAGEPFARLSAGPRGGVIRENY
jgi:hypothetical protein